MEYWKFGIKMKNAGGPASHIDQGRHSRFTARVLQRPGAHLDTSAPGSAHIGVWRTGVAQKDIC